MDRSFLSDAAVIAASRKFVCIRVASYEDEAETAFCRSLMLGRSGEVENTTFTILAPDGKTPLVRTARSTKSQFADAADMARQLNDIGSRYSTQADRTSMALPIALDARIGLDIAACDNQPLVVVADQIAERRELEARVARLAWSADFIGTCVYATAAKDIPGVTGLPSGSGVAIIEPDAFGQSGRLLHYVPASASAAALQVAMRHALQEVTFSAKSRHSHREAGIKLGAFWQTKFPVTDPEEARARERTRQSIDQGRSKN